DDSSVSHHPGGRNVYIRIQLTDTILEVLIPQPTGPVIDITSPEKPKSLLVAPKVVRGKGKVIDDVESPPKIVKASLKIHPDPDTPIWVTYMIHEKMYQLTKDEIQAYLDKEEKIEQVAKEAKLSKPELIKVVHEKAAKAGVDPKIMAMEKGG
nr:hypothetical protein [Tanacetum cinerariifolium]